MGQIIQLYESPAKDIHAVLRAGEATEFDILRPFSEACRMDLTA